MFAYCSGKIIARDTIHLTILPNGSGLGIEVLASPKLLAEASQNENIECWIHHHITDVSQLLFGFNNTNERALFRELIRVSGIGGKTALNMLGLGEENLKNAIQTEDDKILSSIPGIGKKTAQKIIVDLKGSINFSATENNKKVEISHTDTTLLTSLVGMGYDKNRVESIIGTLDPTLPLPEKVKIAIKKLG